MGKFAGFLKRIKKAAGFGMNLLSGLNDIYKGVSPVAESVISALPGGSIINKGLNIGSKLIDRVQPYAQKYLVDEDNKEDLERFEQNVKRYGGNIAQKALNNYLDTQERIYSNKGDYSLSDYGFDTAKDVMKNVVKKSKPIFGKPLNMKDE